jgi:hypothetical protein
VQRPIPSVVNDETCGRRLGTAVLTAWSTGGVSKAPRQPHRPGHAELPEEPARCGRPSANALARMRGASLAGRFACQPVQFAHSLEQ